MPPEAYNKWINYLDRLEEEYKKRCQKCQLILAATSEITISKKEKTTVEGKEKEKKKNKLIKDLATHLRNECKQVQFCLSTE